MVSWLVICNKHKTILGNQINNHSAYVPDQKIWQLSQHLINDFVFVPQYFHPAPNSALVVDRPVWARDTDYLMQPVCSVSAQPHFVEFGFHLPQKTSEWHVRTIIHVDFSICADKVSTKKSRKLIFCSFSSQLGVLWWTRHLVSSLE